MAGILIVTRIPVARVTVGDGEREAIARVLASGWLTTGPEVEAFEREFAAAVGARYACAVSSGTAALHLALIAAGVRPGDEVITVSYSFIATTDAIRMVGAVPVFIDVDPRTGNIDASLVDAAVSDRTRAILCVHQVGMPCDLPALVEIASRRGLRLIEDAACAAGSEILWDGEWQRVGRPHGDLACFSFHPRKVLTTGDGGMITTNDEAQATRIRRLRSHGMSVAAHDRHASDRVRRESYVEPGFNYRLTDLQAAIGRVQLTRLGAFVARRRELAAQYETALAGMPGVTTPREPAWARSNWQSYVIRLDDRFDRDGVMQRLLDAGVATRPGVLCAHLEPAYPAGSWRAGSASLEHSEGVRRHGLVIPLHPEMTCDEQTAVVGALRDACRP